MSWAACLKWATVVGFFPITRRELSPRPIPSTMRPPERAFSVARALAVTSTVRTRGLVTQVPKRMRSVLSAISVSNG